MLLGILRADRKKPTANSTDYVKPESFLVKPRARQGIPTLSRSVQPKVGGTSKNSGTAKEQRYQMGVEGGGASYR